jgi:hypothetical protein
MAARLRSDGVAANGRRVYNVGVATPAPSKPGADDKHRHRHVGYAAEASGLLVIALLLLILTVVRYWENIRWSAR